MRNRLLHQTLRALVEHAAVQLAADTAAGAEIPFEVVESRGSRASLYSYHPLTAEFIRQRMSAVGRLDTYDPAARVLAGLEGLDVYLRSRGERRIPDDPAERADAVLRAFMSRLWEDSSDFELVEGRFAHIYEELEATVYATRWLISVIAPLPGLALSSERVAMGDGMWLVRSDALDDLPPDAAWGAQPEGPHGAALALLELESTPQAPASLAAARERLRMLVGALRLYDVVDVALAPVGWMREDVGAWQLVALGAGGHAAETLIIEPNAEDELRAFVSLVTRRRPAAGELRWALRRFELACERADPLEALTDVILAGRALLEPEGPASGRLAQRLSAICAEPDDRTALAERVAHAISLERAVISGLEPAASGAGKLADELRNHLRAVLRDVMCGHLDSDLIKVADGLLDEAASKRQEELAGVA
jgi:hypothetical protein